jgi:hypothetical protein
MAKSSENRAFCPKTAQAADTIARYFNRLCGKFVTRRNNGIFSSINELKPAYQPNNNRICASPENGKGGRRSGFDPAGEGRPFMAEIDPDPSLSAGPGSNRRAAGSCRP